MIRFNEYLCDNYYMVDAIRDISDEYFSKKCWEAIQELSEDDFNYDLWYEYGIDLRCRQVRDLELFLDLTGNLDADVARSCGGRANDVDIIAELM